MINRLASVGVALTFLLATAVASLAQSEAPKPKNGAALEGYCPVAYGAMNQAVKGDPRHKSEHESRTYHFANAEAKQMFDQAPAKYLPAYDGLCTTGIAQGMKMQVDPALFTVHDGRTYLFSTAEAKAMFEKDKSSVIGKADANWPKVKQQK